MKRLISILVMLVLIADFTGCAALRKKFVRKRRKDLPPPLYLELKDYPNVPTEDMYHQYWLFVRGWLDELKQSIEEEGNRKRQKKAIDEAVMNFEQIVYFFNEEGKQVIAPLHQELLSIQEEVDDPSFSASGNTGILLRRITKAKRDFERDYTYAKASVWLEKE